MNFNLKESQEEMGRLIDAAQKLVADSEARGEKTMPAEINAKFDELMDEHGKLEKDVQRKLDISKITNSQVEKVEEKAERLVKSVGELQDDAVMARSIFDSWLRKKPLTEAQREYQVRAQTTQTDSSGGHTIDEVIFDEITLKMAAFGGMRSVCNVIQTSTGGPFQFVVMDDTANNGAWLAENTAAAAQDTAYTNVTLNAYKASSDYMLVPFELLQDSKFDYVGHINQTLAERLGRRTNLGYTSGSASSQPSGIDDTSALGATNDVAAVIDFDDLLDLKHSVDPAYRNAAATNWMFNDTVLRDLKKTSLASANQSLWQMGAIAGEPNTIDGHSYVVNNDMADIATNSHSVLFGDFNKYIIRDVAGMQIKRSDHIKFLEDQATFVGFLRTDGKLVDSNAVKHMRTIGT
jgi:HK97 family phage major capsid protein